MLHLPCVQGFQYFQQTPLDQLLVYLLFWLQGEVETAAGAAFEVIGRHVKGLHLIVSNSIGDDVVN